MERMLKSILYHVFMMAGIVIVLVGGAALAYKASEPKDLKESEDGYYEIYTAYDYERFWQKVTHNMPFVCGRLMSDIYLNDMENYDNWECQVLTRKNREVPLFTGDFDGNGHTVYGLYSENGYGMVEENAGTIHDISIKKSLITGEKDLGGICLYNYGTISGCEFGGELKSLTAKTDVYSRMAGISTENEGVIVRCGYKGSMKACVQSEHRTRAGISITNRGEIISCYNFTWEDTDKEDNFYYAITNHGERCCLVREEVRWKSFYDGQIMSLDGMQELYLKAFLDKDLYTIYFGLQNPPACFVQVAQMEDRLARVKWEWEDLEDEKNYGMVRVPVIDIEKLSNKSTEAGPVQKMLRELGIDEKQDTLRKALLDENVCDLIWSVLVYEGINWDCVVLEGIAQEEKGKEPVYGVRIYNRYYQEQHIRLAGYVIEVDGEKNYDTIWDFCTELLMEEDAESWRHDTWRIFDGGLVRQGDGYFILYRTKKRESGFFYTAGGMLYQVEIQGETKEADRQRNPIQVSDIEQKEKMGKILDILTVKRSIKNFVLKGEWEDLEFTDNTHICNKIWRVMVEKLWEDVGYVY
ncbi:hypothetical protein [Parablautia muri]|nr:hypothetical protein [Parablautia muri]